jgi:hypothetical protein
MRERIISSRIKVKIPFALPGLFFIDDEPEGRGNFLPKLEEPFVSTKETIVTIETSDSPRVLAVHDVTDYIKTCLIEQTKDRERNKIPHHTALTDVAHTVTSIHTQVFETLQEHPPFLTRQCRCSGNAIHDH